MKHNDLDEVGRKSHYELENELEALQERLGTLQAAPIPEITLSFTATATLPAGARFFYLPRDHFYEAGRSPSHITRVVVDGVDKTAGEGTVWDECVRGGAGAFPGRHLQAVASTYDGGTIGNLTWGIERLVTAVSEGWSVQWIEKRIIFNPLQARGCRMSGSTTLDTSSAWHDRDHYTSSGVANSQNTNGFIVSGCPDGYQIMVMTCQAPRFTGEGHVGSRGKHWRPSFRRDPRSDTDWEAFYIGRFKTNRLIGIALYNPLTGARSDVRLVGYNGWNSALGEDEIRVLK